MGRIVALAGDIKSKEMGLNSEIYKKLATEIGVIFHSAAWVNMALPYPSVI